ncbi:MAG: hypothetical protein KGY99_08830 [Phycisphaerae bacterium]|nr:hypothetical protein [Phycisphaerae bacterium]
MTMLHSDHQQAPSDEAQTDEQSHRTGGAAGTLRLAGTGNLVLGGVLVAGLVVVWVLGMRTGPSEASGDSGAQRKTDALLTHLSQTSDTDPGDGAVINERYFAAAPRQIPPDNLKTNPFEFAAPPADDSGKSVASDDPKPASDKPAARLDSAYERALGEVRGLELQTVLTDAGGQTMAMISNNLLTEGQVIAGWTVVRIEADRVVLRWRDRTHTLNLR